MTSSPDVPLVCRHSSLIAYVSFFIAGLARMLGPRLLFEGADTEVGPRLGDTGQGDRKISNAPSPFDAGPNTEISPAFSFYQFMLSISSQ